MSWSTVRTCSDRGSGIGFGFPGREFPPSRASEEASRARRCCCRISSRAPPALHQMAWKWRQQRRRAAVRGRSGRNEGRASRSTPLGECGTERARAAAACLRRGEAAKMAPPASANCAGGALQPTLDARAALLGLGLGAGGQLPHGAAQQALCAPNGRGSMVPETSWAPRDGPIPVALSPREIIRRTSKLRTSNSTSRSTMRHGEDGDGAKTGRARAVQTSNDSQAHSNALEGGC